MRWLRNGRNVTIASAFTRIRCKGIGIGQAIREALERNAENPESLSEREYNRLVVDVERALRGEWPKDVGQVEFEWGGKGPAETSSTRRASGG